MRFRLSARWLRPFVYVLSVVLIAVAVWFGKPYWGPLLGTNSVPTENEGDAEVPVDEPKVLKLSATARENLGVKTEPVRFKPYWKSIQVPGIVEDRPGITDRAITVPIAGVVAQIFAFEGDLIQPGDKLFSIKLVSEYLQKTQSDLFRAIREVEIFNQEITRIQRLIDSGSLAGKRKIELKQQISRQNALIDAFRQELVARGFSKEDIERVEEGQFLTSIDIFAPSFVTKNQHVVRRVEYTKKSAPRVGEFLEIQQLKVELGQQVDAGQALAVLANHQSLYLKGHAFRKEATLIARAAEQNWSIKVDFSEDPASKWPALEQPFQIRHLSNTTDPNSRTFDFYIPLTNQARFYQKENQNFVVWRFRPGQRVNLSIPLENIENVLVIPSAAVVFEGPEAYVFQQNGDLFNRIPVKVVHQDRYDIVIANDGSISPGVYLAQNAAASLNRVLKAQAASGMRADVHVHADGSVHANH